MTSNVDPLLRAQDVKRCQLCTDKDRKSLANIVCNTCNVSLCEDCVGHHMMSFPTIKHNVDTFEYKNSEIVPPQCKLDGHEKCDKFCYECNSPICFKCTTSGSHENHTIKQISDMCNSKQDIIRKDVQKLESELAPAFESIFSEIEIMESDVLNKHGERRQAITEFGRKCHKVVDIVMTKYLSDSKEIERRDLDSIKSLKAKIQDQKSSVKSEIQEKHSILESKDAFKLASYTSKNNEYRDVPSWFELKIPPFHPNELSELALFQLIGEIPETEKTYIRGHVLEEPEIVGTVSTGNHETNRVNCIPNTNEFYVCGVSEIIKRMNTEGELLEMITTKSKTSPSNLTVNREGDLIYTDVDDKNIYIVKNGQIRCLIRLFKWTPRGICSTSSDDLLVALLLKGDTKIVRYSDSTVTQEIQYKDTGEPLYHDPASMEENKNGDIVVSNWATNTVVVVNNEGKFKFEYKGNHQNNLEDTFTPDGVATDSMCHILIADRNNHIVHVIDRNGQILVYIDSCNIQYPYDLSTDSKDMLFVAEFKTDLVKVIKYLK